MTAPEYSDRASRALREYFAEPTPGEVSAEDRDAAIAAIGDAIAERARRKRAQRRVAMGIGGLAVAAAFAGLWPSHSKATAPVAKSGLANVEELRGSAEVESPSGKSGVARGATLPEGATLSIAPESEARFAYGSGTSVLLRNAAQVGLVEQDRSKIFALTKGSFSAKVAKLEKDERFVVRTSDAEVEVRGTAFTVSIVPADAACGNGTTTRLSVSEGVVVIRNGGIETRVAAGSAWPECKPAEVKPVVTASAHAELVRTPKETPVRSGSTGQEHPSALAEQNDLFAAAMVKKRSGDSSGAIAVLEQLMSSYPNCPLAESAAAEKMKIAHSKAAAEQYLKRYPTGFAQSDAEGILAGK